MENAISAVKKKKLADALANGKMDKIAKAAGAIVAGKRVLDFPHGTGSCSICESPRTTMKDEEKVKMFMKLSKRELIAMLMESQRLASSISAMRFGWNEKHPSSPSPHPVSPNAWDRWQGTS